jgi:Flp pilus assembly protein protease CpaA
VSEFLRKRGGRNKIVAGIIMLIISVPVFILYNYFPTLNSQIGPHQIASWIAVALSFLGFVSIIMGAGELDL